MFNPRSIFPTDPAAECKNIASISLRNLILAFLVVLGCSLAAVLANTAIAQDALLPEDAAFVFIGDVKGDSNLEAKWQIADGYYIYKDKVSFETADGNQLDVSYQLPAGIVKQDDLFGEVEVYTEDFAVSLQTNLAESGQFVLVAKAQGCNEPIGVCYPPMVRTIKYSREENGEFVVFADKTPTTPESADSDRQFPASQNQLISALDSASELRSLLSVGFNQEKFLAVDDAFQLQMEAYDDSSLKARFAVAEGYYLYRDKIKFRYNNQLLATTFPQGVLKQDEYFGEVETFEENFSATVQITHRQGILSATYQGCASEGICYAPVSQEFSISDVVNNSENTTAENSDSAIAASFNTRIETGTTNQVDTAVTQTPVSETAEPLFGLLIGAFFAGILLTFTPCVLPLIPILSSVIAGQGNTITRTRGGLLAVVYVIGTMITYAAMGALAGATGDQLQAYFQNIWAIGFLCILFFIMALSMFGLYEIQMPGFIQERIQTKTGRLGGSIPLVLILGIFSALIVGACVSPVLISFLGVAMASQNPVLGAQLMTAMALGMGVPLIAVGIGAGHIVPRAGQWMEKIKQGFGVLLIGVAIYLLGQLPQIPVLLVWGGFFIILSIFLGSTQSVSNETRAWQRLEKGIGIVLLVWGMVLMLGGFLGQRDLFKPIPTDLFGRILQVEKGLSGSQSYPFTYINSISQLEAELGQAKMTQKTTIIDYYADWCVDCVRMEKTTFSDLPVKAVLENRFVTLKVDVTDPNDEYGKALKRRYKVFGPPATIFVDPEGNILEQANFYGYRNADEFLTLLDSL